MKDVEMIMGVKGLNWPGSHLKFGRSKISFAACDSVPCHSDITFINQAEEITYEFAKDLMRRTRGIMIYDLSEISGTWIEREILSQPDCAFLQTNYLDNPFIPLQALDDIEWCKKNDPESYNRFYVAK